MTAQNYFLLWNVFPRERQGWEQRRGDTGL